MSKENVDQITPLHVSDEVNACSVVTSDDCVIPSLRFPQKLWRIVNECKTGAIGWGPAGQTILLNYKHFQNEYLNCEESVFKTSNIASFIRQLNLYGFRKVNSHHREISGNFAMTGARVDDVHEFLHEHFKVGRLDLLSRVCRKTGVKKGLLQKQTTKHQQPQSNTINSQNQSIGMTKLQMCKLALTKALEQATKQYRKEKSWLQLSKQNFPKDDFKSKIKTETIDQNVQIIFQDFSELQTVETLPIIDVSTVENVIGLEDKVSWEEVLTLPSENAISISLPY